MLTYSCFPIATALILLRCANLSRIQHTPVSISDRNILDSNRISGFQGFSKNQNTPDLNSVQAAGCSRCSLHLFPHRHGPHSSQISRNQNSLLLSRNQIWFLPRNQSMRIAGCSRCSLTPVSPSPRPSFCSGVHTFSEPKTSPFPFRTETFPIRTEFQVCQDFPRPKYP